MATDGAGGTDELVQAVSLHNPRQLLFNGYVLPFVLAELAWIYGWLFVYGLHDYYEPGLVGIAVIGVLQIFVCLCCQWSVHVHAFLNCSSVSLCPPGLVSYTRCRFRARRT